MNWNTLTRSRTGCAVVAQNALARDVEVGLATPEVALTPVRAETATTGNLFNGTPNAKSFVVPQGVTSLNLAVAGASGGAGTTSLFVNNGAGGLGALISGSVAVDPGDTVTFYGSAPGEPSGNNGAGGAAGTGYLEGGTGGSKTIVTTGPDRAGGGGGGASAVLVNGVPVIIAGGGGGGGGRGLLPGSGGGDGGNSTCQGRTGQFAGGDGGDAGRPSSGNQSSGARCDTSGGGGGGGAGYSSGAGGQGVALKGGGGGGGGGNFYASNLVDLVVTTNHIAGGSVKIEYRVTHSVTAAVGTLDGN